MKRRTIALTALMLVLILAGCGGGKATEGLEFTQRNGSYAVTGYHGSDVDVVIPDTYNDVPVTVIAEEAFARSDIQSIRLGSNIETIEDFAFAYSTLLKKVELNAALKEIGTFESYSMYLDGVFEGCTGLETVSIPQNSQLEILGKGTFCDCEKLSGIELPDSLLMIGNSAFKNCVSLKSITIPASVEHMQYEVFENFTSQQKIIVMGSTEEWTYTWNSDCEAEIVYKK